MQLPNLGSVLIVIAGLACGCKSDSRPIPPPVPVDAGSTGGMIATGGSGGAEAPLCDASAPDKCAVCVDETGCMDPVYTVNGDGTVRSSCCGLVWQQAVVATRYSGEEANAYCLALSLAGNGWRLPTVAELRSLVLSGQTPKAPTIDRVAFPDTPLEGFWSASTDVTSVGYKWYVSFFGGFADGNGANSSYLVRCVR